MLSFLFKPKWQHREEAVRAEAVATLRDPDLLRALPRLAREDAGPSVRRAALERLDDRTLWLRAAQDEADEGLRTLARRRVLKELLSSSDGRPYESLVTALTEPDTLERIASEARSALLRRNALGRIERPGLLADRALADPDADIRLWLAQRLEPGPSLERLLEAARTRDKRVYKVVREKLDTARRQQGAPELVEREALALCRRLEILLRELPTDAAEQASRIEQAWQSFGNQAPASLAARFEGTLDTLRRALAAILEPPAPPAPAAAVEPTPAPDQAAASAVPLAPEPQLPDPADFEPDAVLAELSRSAVQLEADTDSETVERLRGSWQQRWSAVRANPANQGLKLTFEREIQRVRGQLEARAATRRADRERYVRLLELLELALENADPKAARTHASELAELVASHRDLDQGNDGKRHAGLRQRLAKLDSWQRWSNNQARVALCEQVESLGGAGLHPDAIAARIKELQLAWGQLDKIEGLSPEQAKALGLARRFRALCFQALKPAQGFFEKRAEVRKRHTADFETQLAHAESQLQVSPVDANALAKTRRELGEGFRELDRTDPARRAELARRMKVLIERISQAIDARNAEVRAEKEKLVALLRTRLKHAQRDEAIEHIKSVQQRFKALGRGERASDQALWDELKALCDPQFAALKAEREQLDQAAQAEIEAQKATIAEVRALVDQAAAHPGSTAQALAALEQRWNAFDQREPAEAATPEFDPRGNRARKAEPSARQRAPAPGGPTRELHRAFAEAEAAVRAALAETERARGDAQTRLLREKSALCSGVESQREAGAEVLVDTERSAWMALAQLAEPLESRLRERFERALAGDNVDPALLQRNIESARRLALLVEFLDSRPSPPEWAAARMDLQVRRLAARMSGQDGDPVRERSRLVEEFHCLGPLPAAIRAEVDARIAG